MFCSCSDTGAQKREKVPKVASKPNQSVTGIKKQTFKENEMPPLIGRGALVSPAKSSNRYR
ncbi:unnamed protein product [Xyrichtys novacula]|uniref:Unnamed protein product n=1 Tax=Xyrichtys novacula TaxID=13765 RepID=A0AAV1GSL3_XYRNO|nr:unnamed protein product [Xyrichtys novacula]